MQARYLSNMGASQRPLSPNLSVALQQIKTDWEDGMLFKTLVLENNDGYHRVIDTRNIRSWNEISSLLIKELSEMLHRCSIKFLQSK